MAAKYKKKKTSKMEWIVKITAVLMVALMLASAVLTLISIMTSR